MKRSQISAIVILSFMLIIILCNSFITKIFNQYSICAFIAVFIVAAYYTFGFEKNRPRYTKDVILSLVINCVIYYIVIYFVGLIVGFSHNIYNLELLKILKNIVPIMVVILLTEVLRYMINVKIKENNWLLSLSIIVFALLDTTLVTNTLNFGNFEQVLTVVGLYLLPSVSKSFLLTYLSIKVGYKPGIIYCLIMQLPLYLVPIVPNFGLYIESIIRMVIPLIIASNVNIMFKKVPNYNKIIKVQKHPYKTVVYIISTFLILLIVGLTCGYFKYQAIVVATGSMVPNINKGDVVVVKKLNEKEIKELEVGDILVFRFDNRIVVHRIHEKLVTGNETFFHTKGDHNNAPDNYLVEVNEAIGTAITKIPYVGYPTVMLFERINSSK